MSGVRRVAGVMMGSLSLSFKGVGNNVETGSG